MLKPDARAWKARCYLPVAIADFTVKAKPSLVHLPKAERSDRLLQNYRIRTNVIMSAAKNFELSTK